MKLSNKQYAGKTLVTSFGNLTFDGNGDTNAPDEAVEALVQLPGFSTDHTDPADNDLDTTFTANSGDVEHAENEGHEITQEGGETTQNGNEGTEGGEEPGEKEDAGDEGAEDGQPSEGEKPDELTEAELKKMQVPSLKKLCKDRGIDITGITTKQPLINLLLGK